jgi:hypothetical protein
MKPLFIYWVISRILQDDFRRWAYEPVKPILIGGRHVHIWFRRWIKKPDQAETYDSLTRRIYERKE